MTQLPHEKKKRTSVEKMRAATISRHGGTHTGVSTAEWRRAMLRVLSLCGTLAVAAPQSSASAARVSSRQARWFPHRAGKRGEIASAIAIARTCHEPAVYAWDLFAQRRCGRSVRDTASSVPFDRRAPGELCRHRTRVGDARLSRMHFNRAGGMYQTNQPQAHI